MEKKKEKFFFSFPQGVGVSAWVAGAGAGAGLTLLIFEKKKGLRKVGGIIIVCLVAEAIMDGQTIH